jgi:hypothetical protein
MVASEKMPPSAHDFALRDMAFSNSEQCLLVRQPPGFEPASLSPRAKPDDEATTDRPPDKAPYLFFPGCQLAASDPEHVISAYAWLRNEFDEGVALALGCCGAPADWAGRDDLFQQTLDGIQSIWEKEGRPTLILACSSCRDVISRNLPHILTISLWQVIDSRGLPLEALRGKGETVNIHDACTARHESEVQKSVRGIIEGLGYGVEELRYSGEDTKCCGFGGLVFFANREQEADFAVDRAKESPYTLVVYCAMCKDLFINEGKKCVHLLDLLFAKDIEECAGRRMPTLSERQAHRKELKRRLLSEVWGEEELPQPVSLPGYTVNISEEVLALIDERLILVTDLEDALAYALDNPGERFYNSSQDCYLINIRKQYVTYWICYVQRDDTIDVLSAYSHRMEILGQDSAVAAQT